MAEPSQQAAAGEVCKVRYKMPFPKVVSFLGASTALCPDCNLCSDDYEGFYSRLSVPYQRAGQL